MKFIVFILIAVGVATCYQQNPTYKEIKAYWQTTLVPHLNSCINQTGADPVLAVRVLPHGEYVDNYKLKCFMKCIMYNQDMVKDDGTANPDGFLKVLALKNPDVVTEGYLHSCFAIKLSDPCETAFKITECIHKSVGMAVDLLHPAP